MHTLSTCLQAGYKGVGIDLAKPAYINSDEELSRSCLFIEADLTDEEQLEGACKEACDWLGGSVSVLVNNAG